MGEEGWAAPCAEQHARSARSAGPRGEGIPAFKVLEPVGQRAALKGERESQMTARRAERSRARGQLWPGAEASQFTLYHLMEPRPTPSLSLSLPSGHSRTPAPPPVQRP